MMNISEEITQAIKDKLPGTVGEVLQGELAKLQQLRLDNERLQRENKDLEEGKRNGLKERSELLKEVGEFRSREASLRERESNIEKREKSLEVTLLQAEVANVKQNFQQLLDLNKILFRSPVIKKTVMEGHNTSSGFVSANKTELSTELSEQDLIV